MRRRLRRCATRRHIALAPGVSSPRLLHSLAGWRRRAKKADSISREIPISGLAIGWKLSPFAIWPHETGLSKAIARLACQSESSDIAGAAALESALGTTETSQTDRSTSAFGAFADSGSTPGDARV